MGKDPLFDMNAGASRDMYGWRTAVYNSTGGELTNSTAINVVTVRRTAFVSTVAISSGAPSTAGSSVGYVSIGNTSRVELRVFNPSSVRAYIGLTSAVSSATGYIIPSSGEFIDNCSTSIWFAKSSAATPDLRILEFR